MSGFLIVDHLLQVVQINNLEYDFLIAVLLLDLREIELSQLQSFLQSIRNGEGYLRVMGSQHKDLDNF